MTLLELQARPHLSRSSGVEVGVVGGSGPATAPSEEAADSEA